MITSRICDGSSIDANRFRTSDVVEPFRGPEPGRDLVHGVRIDHRADLDARETADLVVLGDGVAVDLNRRDGLAALPCRCDADDVRAGPPSSRKSAAHMVSGS